MNTPSNWRELERHPLSAAYADITGQQWEDFVANLVENGLGDREIVMHEGKVLDGWQLLRACIETNTKPKLRKLAAGVDPQTFVETQNDHRRQMTPEEMMARRAARVARVAEKRQAGESIRQIAEEEKVSKATVERDLETSGVPGGTPEALGAVKGRDGKLYPAKPAPILCERCKRLNVAVPGCEGCKGMRMAKPTAAPKPEPLAAAPKSPPNQEAATPKAKPCVACNGTGWVKPTEGLPFELDVPEFVTAWETWKAYLRQKRHKLTPLSEQSQLAKMADVGADAAVKMIKQSIEKGWIGLFDPQENANGKQRKTGTADDSRFDYKGS